MRFRKIFSLNLNLNLFYIVMEHIHKTRLRVRYQETDNMGIVYYSNYFIYFEVARTECFRNLGIAYTELEKRGTYLVVVEAFCNYILPVHYDDIIEIDASVIKSTKSKLQFDYKVFNLGRDSHSNSKAKLSSTGFTRHVFINRNARPIKIPASLEEVLNKN